MLGLQNPAAPYPFMAAIHIEDSRREALEALPPNREILRYVMIGYDSGHVLISH